MNSFLQRKIKEIKSELSVKPKDLIEIKNDRIKRPKEAIQDLHFIHAINIKRMFLSLVKM